jgi:DNA-binding FadR family transcriptional regulator
MTAQHPTKHDLLAISLNLQAEGETSRAEVISNAAKLIEAQAAELAALRAEVETLKKALQAFMTDDIHSTDCEEWAPCLCAMRYAEKVLKSAA